MKLKTLNDAPGPTWKEKLAPLFKEAETATRRLEELGSQLTANRAAKQAAETAAVAATAAEGIAKHRATAAALGELIERQQSEYLEVEKQLKQARAHITQHSDRAASLAAGIARIDAEIKRLEEQRKQLHAKLYG